MALAPELGVLLLESEIETPTSSGPDAEPPRNRWPGRLPRRQAVGLILVFMLILAGRLVRTHMLLGPDGQWRDPLWLAELLPPVETATAGQHAKKKPKLTGPLPINTCSMDSLTLLPRVGPVLAARIAAARDSGVVFLTPADLQQVKGIGPSLSAKLAPLVVFEAPNAAESDSSAQSR